MYSGPTQGYMVKIGRYDTIIKIQRALHKAITTSYSRDITDTHLLCLLTGAGHLWWRVMDMLGGRCRPLALGPQNYVDNDRKGGAIPYGSHCLLRPLAYLLGGQWNQSWFSIPKPVR